MVKGEKNKKNMPVGVPVQKGEKNLKRLSVHWILDAFGQAEDESSFSDHLVEANGKQKNGCDIFDSSYS